MKSHENTINPWQLALKEMVTDPEELLALLELDGSLLDAAKASAKKFPLKVPRGFIRRMQKGNAADPLLRQVLPLQEELIAVPGYGADPLQETQYNPLPGLLHKYHGRVLLTLTGACAVNCRYCFRRDFAYEENNPGSKGWEAVLDYIQKDASISEVILSGGDPLVASDASIKNLCHKLGDISHIKRVRIHSRVPIVMPERITAELIEAITHPSFQTIMVVHANHPREIDKSVSDAMLLLKEAHITLLNQSVLLNGVNDDSETLIALSETLFAAGILPYYLHVLDKVAGAAHFDLARETACRLHVELRKRLPGYLVPKLVSEQPGAMAKMPIYTA